MEIERYSAVLRELECPICTNYMFPPILQCTNGHSYCETCYLQLKICPVCQSPFTGVRNRSLEAVVDAMAAFPCINEKYGCKLKMPIQVRIQHEQMCKYKIDFPCMKEGCSWFGRREDILKHWCSKQLAIPPYKRDNVCYMELSNGFYHVNIIEAHDQLFWFQQKTSGDKVYFVVQFIGVYSDVKHKYVYELQLGRERKHLLLRYPCQIVNWKEENPTHMKNANSLSLEDIKKYCNCTVRTHYKMRVMQL